MLPRPILTAKATYAHGHHRFLAQEQVPRLARNDRAGDGRRLCAQEHTPGCHPGPFGRPGDCLYRMAGPGAADRAGPGDLPDHHQDALGAQGQGGPRLLLFRVLVRLRYFYRWDRSLLGAEPRARISQRLERSFARRRVTQPGARRHRRRVGLHVFHQLDQPRLGRVAFLARLVFALPTGCRRRRVRSCLDRGFREAIPGHGRSGQIARLQPVHFRSGDGRKAQQRRGGRTFHRIVGEGVYAPRARLPREAG